VDDILTKEPIFTAVLSWDPSTVRSSEQCADAGNFTLSADLSEWISTKDTRVVSALETRFEPPMCLDFEEESGFIGENWPLICPWEEELSIKRDILILGFAFVEITSQRLGSRWYPRIWRKNPRFLRFNKTTQTWELKTRDSEFKPIEINNGEYAILSTKTRDRPWVYGLYRALSRWTLLTHYALDDCANFSNRYGTGTWVVNGDTDEKRRKLVSELRSMGRNGVIGLPKDVILSLVESQAKSYEVFFEQLRVAHQEISIAIVGANLTTQANAGAGQVASVHLEQQVSRWVVDNTSFANVMHSRVLSPYGQLVGETYERPIRDISDIKDDRVIAAARQSNSQAIVGAKNVGVPISDREARDLLFIEDENED
jgi:phage gp29-like protein